VNNQSFLSRDDFLEKQKKFLTDKRENPELEYQDLADMRASYYGTIEHRDTVRKGSKIINEYIDAGWDLVPQFSADTEESLELKSTVELKKDGTTVSDRLIQICEGEEITPELLLKAHNLSPEKWKVISYRNNYWHSQISGGKRLLMYQSRVVVKPYDYDEISPYQLKKWFEQFKPEPIDYENVAANYGEGENCLLLPVVDLHYNLLSTTFITGNEYNCKIAASRFMSVIDDVISRVKDKSISKILFPIGNDLFNANGINGSTFKGTPQTNEKHIFEAYVDLFNLMVNAIDKLSIIAPVDVIYIPSNHDKEVTWYFIFNLNTKFEHSQKVNIDYSPLNNKYRRHGRTILAFAHDAKVDKMGNVVFDEAKEMLNPETSYVEVFLAHLHTEMVKQERNITIRRLPTFSGKSSWTVENNYGSNCTSQSFIINDKRNITDIIFTTIE
jgi:hypothetical protein